MGGEIWEGKNEWEKREGAGKLERQRDSRHVLGNVSVHADSMCLQTSLQHNTSVCVSQSLTMRV